MRYELYAFDDLSKYVKGKVINQAKKLMKKNNPDFAAKNPLYVEKNQEQLNGFLYNKNGRPICTKKIYEEGKL